MSNKERIEDLRRRYKKAQTEKEKLYYLTEMNYLLEHPDSCKVCNLPMDEHERTEWLRDNQSPETVVVVRKGITKVPDIVCKVCHLPMKHVLEVVYEQVSLEYLDELETYDDDDEE